MSSIDEKTRTRARAALRIPAGISLAQHHSEWKLRGGDCDANTNASFVHREPRLALKEGKRSRGGSTRKIRSLRDHSEPYVTTAELAKYWLVSRKQIYKQIEAGTLKAIRLGPRLLRISTAEALDFERRAKMTAADDQASRRHHAADYKTRSR